MPKKPTKNKKKHTKKEVERVHDLAERMMAGGHVPNEITNPYALSWYMFNKKPSSVKEKPSKPHARVKPFEKKKKKKAEYIEDLVKVANILDENNMIEDANKLDKILLNIKNRSDK